jgi:hypothetical protein
MVMTKNRTPLKIVAGRDFEPTAPEQPHFSEVIRPDKALSADCERGAQAYPDAENLAAKARRDATRFQNGDPAFALIAQKLAADVVFCEAIDAQAEAEKQDGIGSDEANDCCEAACLAVNALDWRLANTPPTTLAGVAAVLRFANEIEDAGMEWPATDAIGPEGWHYQLRATMAAAIEALIKASAGKAVQS